PDILAMQNLIRIQLDSFEWFKRDGLKQLFAEISPISDFTGRNLELHFAVPDDPFGKPKYTEWECREKDITYSAPLRIRASLKNKQTGEIKEQDIFMGDFPLMTEQGTFIVNGVERVVVSQLVRSPGIYFTAEYDAGTDRNLYYGKLIPNRGAWLEFETSNKNVLTVKIDRKRKIPVTTLLRAIGYGTNEEIVDVFAAVTDPERNFIQETIDRDPTKTVDEGLIEMYKKLRPGDPPTLDNARSLITSLFFNPRRYDLGRVGRYKLNRKLGSETPRETTVLEKGDLLKIVEQIIKLNNSQEQPDDIDHLGNRRIRAVGELIQNQFRVGLLRMERVVKERMTIQDPDAVTPSMLINIRPVVAAMKEFFGGSQLSQFMDQTNPLAELAHKRRLSAMGPGGLSRERAGFDVRDVHHSHYGRICPIETPEGPNIGLIGSLATYARINEFGFIETPYRKVVHPEAPSNGHASDTAVAPRAHVSDEIEYLAADEEEKYIIAQANARLGPTGEFVDDRVSCRQGGHFAEQPIGRVQYMDVSPKQIVSVPTALIPFLEHDDANRALMGSNMQRQAVPLLSPEAPLVGTGVERQAALDSGQVVVCQEAGEVVSVTSRQVMVQSADHQRTYALRKFERSNNGTCINQRPIVRRGDLVQPGQALADSSSTDHGELALGQNILCAFMFWDGGNFEDAILISERVVREDLFTSIHIEKHELEARDTKLGPEEITRDIPNVGEEGLRNLDERGIIYVGAEVGAGDILVGKITPKGETELTAEERLLRAIFGEKAREVKDSSLRVPHGESGKVVDVQVFSRENNDELPPGVNQLVRVGIAQKRKISEGDKMAGRHGNKGVVSKVVPIQDMPFLADGTPVDIILNPLGAPSRMNLGQVLETHLGWAAKKMGVRYATPVFDSLSEERIEELLEQNGLPRNGKAVLYDGRTGDQFDREVAVGYIYMLKLIHLVEDKIHARSTGPYSLITQQPLGGKAQFGGQRFGEMEVWALEAYGAANILQEILTVKSDDVVGRVKTYEAIVKGESIMEPGVPESFKVLVKELQSLGLSVEVLNEDEERIQFVDDSSADMMPELGLNLSGFEKDE
ncbi:MAG TPA: DNA-directed RNA polymerase subunit beta, partial [Chloroflexota bacterium]|nr:DNA-directed RNA polymerase subunit beta [Chloroflexota bacterium]